jgi:hypothetical protein
MISIMQEDKIRKKKKSNPDLFDGKFLPDSAWLLLYTQPTSFWG